MEKNKYNILLVHNYYQIPGGEDTVVKNEKNLLEDNGNTVITYFRSNAELKNGSKLKKLLLPFTAIYSFKTVKEVKKLIVDNHIDIVHVHNTLTMVSPSVYYAAFKCKVPVVQTLHNFRMLCPGGSFFRAGQVCEECVSGGLGCSVKHSCYRDSKAQTIVSAAILQIHRILGTYKKINYICLTEFNREKILQLNPKGKQVIDENRIYIKPNFTYNSKEVINEKEDYYVYVGRLEELKGIRLLIDAFIGMPDCKLVVVGDGPLAGEMKQKVVEGGADNITFTGYITGEAYINTVSRAKALVVTSQCYETFGMGIAESFSYGVPAIVGNIGNIKSMVTEGVNGVQFKYNSVEELQNAVNRFENMDGKLLSSNARKYYEANLNSQSNYEKLIDIYEKVRKAEVM